MNVASDTLGPVSVGADELFAFTDGLYGFPECRSFALVQSGRPGLYWLQSADHAALTFLLVDPFLAFPGYEVELPTQERERVDAHDPADVAVLTIVTLPRTRAEQPTANLQAPLALNMRARRGRQVVLTDREDGVRAEFDMHAVVTA